MITEHILSKCPHLKVSPEFTAGSQHFSMFNTGGVETEVGEFLYALVRMVKPAFVLETGTHFGISTSYMGLALKRNGTGEIVTLDPLPQQEVYDTWEKLGIRDIVGFKHIRSLEYVCEKPIDILFLDSEPIFRYDEFVRFYDKVVPGGIIMIHDLHPHFMLGVEVNGMKFWPYGDFREKLGPFIKSHGVQVVSFPTPRGFTLFQKESPKSSTVKFLRGEI